MTDQWDVIVVGGGPPGENAASYAIQGSGRTAAIVEKELLGGECSYWACMPSKALLRPVDVVDAANALTGVRGATLDVAGVLKRRDRVSQDAYGFLKRSDPCLAALDQPVGS